MNEYVEWDVIYMGHLFSILKTIELHPVSLDLCKLTNEFMPVKVRRQKILFFNNIGVVREVQFICKPATLLLYQSPAQKFTTNWPNLIILCQKLEDRMTRS